MKTASVFLADGFEMVEALTPVDYLRRAGVKVVTVSVPSSTSKERNDKLIVESSHKVKVFADTTLENYLAEYSKNLPDCVFCPGGMPGALNLAETSELLSHLQACLENGKIVSAICASPAIVLSKTQSLKGRKWTCYPGMKDDADPKGTENSEHVDNVPFVSDKNVVTGAGAGASEQFAMELVRLLTDEKTAQTVKEKTVQR